MFVSSGCPMVFLQSMAVWCVCVGESRVAEEHSGLSSDFHAFPLLFRQAERLHGQSLPLRHWALTCTHIANPLLHSNRLQALLYYCEGVLWVYSLIAQKKQQQKKTTAAGSSFLVFPSTLSCCRFTLKIHMMHHHGSVELVWVSTGSGLVLLAHQEPWINRGGFASVLPQVRHHAVGRALFRYLFPVVVVLVGLSKQGPKMNSENISLSPVSP